MNPNIEAYLNGELLGEALKQFEAELLRDPALRSEVELMRPLIHDLRRAAITQQVEAAQRNRSRRRRVRLVVIIMLGGLLILTALWWFIHHPAPPTPASMPHHSAPTTPDKSLPINLPPQDSSLKKGQPVVKTQESDIAMRRIALSAYKIPDEYESVRSASDTSVRNRVIWSLKNQNCAVGLDLLKRSKNVFPDALYLKAHLLFQCQRYLEAKNAFLQAGKDPDQIIHRDACEWYTLLSALAEQPADRTTARSLLRHLTEKHSHDYYEKALLIQKNYIQ